MEMYLIFSIRNGESLKLNLYLIQSLFDQSLRYPISIQLHLYLFTNIKHKLELLDCKSMILMAIYFYIIYVLPSFYVFLVKFKLFHSTQFKIYLCHSLGKSST